MEAGKKAPSFALKDKDGVVHRLNDFSSEFTVVYFYPKDDTPGCTIEATEFSENLSKFERLGTRIVGISGGDSASKEKFCRKHDLKVLLLSDPEGAVAKKYGAYGEKNFMGRTSEGFFRKTYVLDKDKRILEVFDQVKAKGHSEEVLELIRTLRRTKA